MFLVYNALLTLLAPFWVPWMLVRSNRRGEPPHWKERCGDYSLEPRKDRKRIWFHAVSVGEVIAARPILDEIRRLLPDHEIVLSVTTSSGHKTAREQPLGLYDHLLYFPIDIARFQLAAMQKVQPAVAVMMETELWMNFLWAAKVFDVRTVLVNGRISDRSYKPWLKFYYSALLKNLDRCLMQTESDAERIKALGAKSTEVLGNSKVDQALSSLGTASTDWRHELGLPDSSPIVVVGSTRGEEEERFILDAFEKLGLGNFAVVHAPRHLERVPALQELLSRAGVPSSLRSKGEGGSYIILDTYGELDRVYAAADVVIVGGGFANLGGQNLIQPMAQGKPVLHGPHMQNFRDVAAAADRTGAAISCATPEELALNLASLLKDANARATMGASAKKLIESNSGASERYAKVIAEEAHAFQAAQTKS